MLYAQRCFDMETLTNSKVTFHNLDISLLEYTVTTNNGKPFHNYTYGWRKSNSPSQHPRQTLITAAGTDELCPSLSVLPPFGNTSIRLAADGYSQPTDSSKGAQVTFSYHVTRLYPLIVIQYAAVLEKPHHPIASEYPAYAASQCRMHVLIDDSLHEELGFNHYPMVDSTMAGFQTFTDTRGNTAVWKDWTIDTLDMSAYIGHDIAIRFDYRDCALVDWKVENENSRTFVFCEQHHTGRMYAHVSCATPYECAGEFVAEQDTLCADAASWTLRNEYTAGSVWTYDLLFDDNAQEQGFVNLLGQQLSNDTASIVVTLPAAGDTVWYPRPDTYQAQLVLHTVCERDTVIPLQLTLLYPSRLIYQRWNDVLSVMNADYNGNYEFSSVQWYKNGEPVSGRGKKGGYYVEEGGFAYSSDSPDSKSDDVFYAALTRADDHKTYCTCAFHPQRANTDSTLVYGQPVSVESQSTHRRTIRSRENGTYYLYNLLGQLQQTGTLSANVPVQIDVPNVSLLLYRMESGINGGIKIQP